MGTAATVSAWALAFDESSAANINCTLPTWIRWPGARSASTTGRSLTNVPLVDPTSRKRTVPSETINWQCEPETEPSSMVTARHRRKPCPYYWPTETTAIRN